MASKPFTAMFDSECPECGSDIQGDYDTIVMVDGEAVHQDCAPEEPESGLVTFAPIQREAGS